MNMADLKEIKKICFKYIESLGELNKIHSVMLYGSAARNYVGGGNQYEDFDLGIFFTKKSPISSTQATPKRIGIYNGKRVETTRSKIPEDADLLEHIHGLMKSKNSSKRWKRIGTEPIILLYPEMKVLQS